MENRTRVELPPAVRRPYEVFINGVAQDEGTDFEAFGSSLVFRRALVPDRKLGPVRWTLLFLGLLSSYSHQGDTIDVVYTLDGRRAVATLKPKGAAAERP